MEKSKQKKRHKINFWKSIRFKYRLTITNENTLEEVFGLYVSKLNGLSVLVTLFILVLLIASLIIAFTPLRNYLPGYMNIEVREQIVSNALKVDSLENMAHKQNQYILNLQHIIKGDISPDSIDMIMRTPLKIDVDSAMKPSAEEIAFRNKYEEKEKYALSEVKENNVTDVPQDIIRLRQPLQGVITNPFNKEKGNDGISILASKANPIIASISGTVIFSGMTVEEGYVIEIQNKDITAVYKHCGKLLKKTGEQVTVGEAIATIQPQTPLVFEVWKAGVAINPTQHFVL